MDELIHTRELNISGFQNVEEEIERIIQEEEYCKVKEVLLVGKDLKITFAHFPKGKKHPSFVKQISKKKHATLEGFLCSQRATYENALLTASLDLGNKWLLFLEK